MLKVSSIIILFFLVCFPMYGQWQPNGTAIYSTNSGNVGVGTSNPSAKLSVVGSIHKLTLSGIDGSYDNLIKYGHKSDLESGNTSANRWHGIDATITAGAAADNKMRFRLYSGTFANAEPVEVMTLVGNGNVGIGTNIPYGKLDVYKTATTNGNDVIASFLRESAQTGGSGIVRFGLHTTCDLELNSGYSSNGFRYGNYEDFNIVNNTANGTYGGINFVTNRNLQMAIKANGNVGIGTSGPNSKFEVNQSSNSEWAAQIFNSGGDGRGLKVKSASGNTIPVLQLEDNYGNIKFIVQSGGNVLIGKPVQTGTGTRYKLDVEGPIRAHEIVVNTTGADFVFEPTYKLRTLSELETFIRTNKHLPDIAPAKEMQENGVSAGEMQAKLLQKVEELTLYVIELKKENEEKDKLLTEQQRIVLDMKKEIEKIKKLK